MKRMVVALTLIGSIAFLLSCNQDETAFGPQDLKAFESGVTGRVTDRAGDPLVGALVTALPSGATRMTDANGKFTLSGLAAGSYRIEVVKDDYRDTMWLDSARLGLAVLQELGVVAMRYRYATITGVVVDTAGTIQSNAGVAVEDQTPTVLASGDGNFVLGRVEPGRIRLFSAIQGVGYGLLDTTLQPDDTLKNVRLRVVRRGGVVIGYIVDSDGKPVANARVQAMGGAIKATTDAQGRFQLSEVPSDGKVAVEVDDDGRTALITGIRVGEASLTNLDTIRIGTTDGVGVRPGVTLGFTTDSVVTIVASTVTKDTSFHILRYLWNIDGGKHWDTTSVNVLSVRPGGLGWKEGSHPVQVRLLALDGRVSPTTTLTVRLIPPPDWTSPVAKKRNPTRDTTYVGRDSVVTVSWTVTDNRKVDSVWIGGVIATSDSGRYTRTLTLSEGRNAVSLRARDVAGNVARDSLILTLLALDTTRPTLGRMTLSRDTMFVFKDSLATLRWSVSDAGGLDSVWIDGTAAKIDSGKVSATVKLALGKTTVRIRVRDVSRNTSTDSLVLTRLALDTVRPSLDRSLAKNDTVLAFEDSSSLKVTWVLSDAGGLDSAWIDGIGVAIDSGKVSTMVKPVVGITVVRLRVRDLSRNERLDSVKVVRLGRDTLQPLLVRESPKADTALYAYADSGEIKVIWTVTDDRKLDSVWICGIHALPDSVNRYSRKVRLEVGDSVIAIRARDASGNERRDSILLIRQSRLAMDSTLDTIVVSKGSLFPAFASTIRSYSDTVLTEDSVLGIVARANDTVQAKVWIAGEQATSKQVALGAAGTITPIHIVVRTNDGDSLEYSVVVWRIAADSTAPVVGRVAPSQDTIQPYADSSATVVWSVTDDRKLDSVWIDGAPVDVVGGKVSKTLTIPVGKTVFRLRAQDATGNVARDSLGFTRLQIDTASLTVTLSRDADSLWPLDTIRATSGGGLEYAIDQGAWSAYPVAGITLAKACSVSVRATESGKAQRFWGRRFGFTTWNPGVSYGSLMDARDNQTYHTVRIGTQNWMAENLNFKADSSWWYDNNADSGAKYGRLYQWSAAMAWGDSCNNKTCAELLLPPNHQGVCPDGWHVPSDAEWTVLTQTVDPSVTDDGTLLKAAVGWYGSGSGLDKHGFRALPAGNRPSSGAFNNAYVNGAWWSASEYSISNAQYRSVGYAGAKLLDSWNSMTNGFSLRCVEGAQTPDLAPPAIVRVSPSVDTLYSWMTDSVAVAWKVSDDRKLGAVTIQGKRVVPDTDGLVTAMITLADTTVAVHLDVSDLSGKHAFDTLRLTRDTTFGIAWNSGITYGVLNDIRDGQEYRTVKIGTQNWMAENLNFKAPRMDSGYWYNGSSDSGAKYGRLYRWETAMALDDSCNNAVCTDQVMPYNHQGICPDNWHIPSDSEWTVLQQLVDGTNTTDGMLLKSSAGWADPGNGSDVYGMRLLPGGAYNTLVQAISGADSLGFWWATNETMAGIAGVRVALYNKGKLSIDDNAKWQGFSVRCLEGAQPVDTARPTITRVSPKQDTAYVASSAQVTWKVGDDRKLSVVTIQGQRVVPDGNGFVTLSVPVTSVPTMVRLDVSDLAGKHSFDSLRIVLDSTYGIAWNDTVTTFGVLQDVRDGQEYRTVKIGNQTWMAENLNFKGAGVDSGWAYEDSKDSAAKYGRLYTWASSMGLKDTCNGAICADQVLKSNHQGICPDGWHMPSDIDWTVLQQTADGSNTIDAMKLKSISGWNSGVGTDEFGFRALAAGQVNGSSSTSSLSGTLGGWWTTSESAKDFGFYRAMVGGQDKVVIPTTPKIDGVSVRCVEGAQLPDTELPKVIRVSPTVDTSYTPGTDSAQVTWKVTDDRQIGVVTIQGKPVTMAGDFATAMVPLALDPVRVRLVVKDVAGKYAYDSLLVMRDSTFGIPVQTGFVYGVLRDDRDNQEYRTVQIGTQNWMAENLNFKGIGKDSGWTVDNSPDSGAKYGRLYSWVTSVGLADSCNTSICGDQILAVGHQGICPAGWHLPSDSEWTVLQKLADLSNSIDARVLKSTSGWNFGKPSDDGLGFRALPGGYRYYDGFFYNVGTNGQWWASNDYSATKADQRNMGSPDDFVGSGQDVKTNGLSVRCIEGTALPDNAPPVFYRVSPMADTTYKSLTAQVTWHVEDDRQLGLVTIQGKHVTPDLDGYVTAAIPLDSAPVMVRLVVSDLAGKYAYDSIKLDFDSTFGIPLNQAIVHGVLKDARDGQEYRTVNIGSQTWMAENLNFKGPGRDSGWSYENSADSGAKYGRLYSWTNALGLDDSCNTVSCFDQVASMRKGVCPDGWHVPYLSDMNAMSNALVLGGDDMADVLKSQGGWATGSPLDRYGFRALPAGVFSDDVFLESGTSANFWVSYEYDVGRGYRYRLDLISPYYLNDGKDKAEGASIRCMADGVDIKPPTITRVSPLQDTTYATGTLQADVTWKVWDDRKVGLVLFHGQFVTPDANGYVTRTITLEDQTVEVLLEVTDTAGQRVYDTLRLTRDSTYGIALNDTVTTYGVLHDVRDGQEYRTVKIGARTWMAENLNVTVASSWAYGNNDDSAKKYGRLYQWASAMALGDSCNAVACGIQVTPKHQGACPDGWHIPTELEWQGLLLHADQLLQYDALKLKSTSGWATGSDMDEFGFRALPGGQRNEDGSYANKGDQANFWSADELGVDGARMNFMSDGVNNVEWYPNGKPYGFSVRCTLE